MFRLFLIVFYITAMEVMWANWAVGNLDAKDENLGGVAFDYDTDLLAPFPKRGTCTWFE